MKIAVSFSGQTGYTNGRLGVGDKLDNNIVYNHLRKHVLEKYKEVDIFIHTWSIEDKKTLIELYKPITIECEKQRTFGIDLNNMSIHEKNQEDANTLGFNLRYISQAYSMNKSLDYVISHENKNNFKYDYVIVLRLDAIFTLDLDTTILNKDCINLQRKVHINKNKNIPIYWDNQANGLMHSSYVIIITTKLLNNSRYKDIYNYHYYNSTKDNIYSNVNPKNTFSMLMVLFGNNKCIESIQKDTVQLARRYYYENEIMFEKGKKNNYKYNDNEKLKILWENYNSFYCK